MEKAVLDRLEDGYAVLLVGESERHVVVPLTALPAEAREGSWLQVELAGERLLSATLDPEETARAHRRIQEKLQRLRRRG